ncbi:MAG: hypothetical protein ACRES7_04745 [Gammaproteobacteria bacterium]
MLDGIENDLKMLIAALIPVQTAAENHPKAPHRNMLARWLLLYKPSGVVSWILHLLFYAYMAFIIYWLIIIIELMRFFPRGRVVRIRPARW